MSDRVWACSISAMAVCMTAISSVMVVFAGPAAAGPARELNAPGAQPEKDGGLQCAIPSPLTGT
jgi:hypothetical protein